MIMPTQKPKWSWVVRRFNYMTGHHEIIKSFDKKEEAHFYTRTCRENADLLGDPYNFVYEKIERRPDLHHERLKEEWGYKDGSN